MKKTKKEKPQDYVSFQERIEGRVGSSMPSACGIHYSNVFLKKKAGSWSPVLVPSFPYLLSFMPHVFALSSNANKQEKGTLAVYGWQAVVLFLVHHSTNLV
jgi:hypothetical protein